VTESWNPQTHPRIQFLKGSRLQTTTITAAAAAAERVFLARSLEEVLQERKKDGQTDR
jgi:hypothetical protein